MKYVGDFERGKMTGTTVIHMQHPEEKPFEFPQASGIIHHGKGECVYEGGILNGAFHGFGCFTYLDGRSYKGQWRHGKRHGSGEQVYIATREEGDQDRFYIGGVDAMYRVAKYKGYWDNDVRHGHGVLFYSNEDSIEGEFVNGHVHGIAAYIHHQSGFEQVGIWDFGTRVRWLTLQEYQLHHQKQAAPNAFGILVK